MNETATRSNVTIQLQQRHGLQLQLIMIKTFHFLAPSFDIWHVICYTIVSFAFMMIKCFIINASHNHQPSYCRLGCCFISFYCSSGPAAAVSQQWAVATKAFITMLFCCSRRPTTTTHHCIVGPWFSLKFKRLKHGPNKNRRTLNFVHRVRCRRARYLKFGKGFVKRFSFFTSKKKKPTKRVQVP